MNIPKIKFVVWNSLRKDLYDFVFFTTYVMFIFILKFWNINWIESSVYKRSNVCDAKSVLKISNVYFSSPIKQTFYVKKILHSYLIEPNTPI